MSSEMGPGETGARQKPSPWRGCLLPAGLLCVVVLAGLVLTLPRIPSTRKLLKAHRAAAEAQFAAIEAIRQTLPEIPKSDGQEAEKPAPGASGVPSSENTALLHEEDLADLSVSVGDPPVRVCDPYPVVTPASLLRRGVWPDGKKIAPLFFDFDNVRPRLVTLEGLKYIIVVRVLNFEPPEMANENQFRSGSYTAEALVFELQGGAYLGKFRFGARNDPTVINTTKATGPPLGNLATNAENAFRTTLAEVYPGFFGERNE